jgi:hypothetical protein
MGGFTGAVPGGKTSLRDAKVLWRRREWPQAQLITASAIGLEKKMYRLQGPPPGTSEDAVDKLWDTFEKPLPMAIARTAVYQESGSDHNTLKGYVAAAGVRHPDFAEAVNRWRAEFGMPTVTGDQVQVDRVALLGRGLKLMEGFRWR